MAEALGIWYESVALFPAKCVLGWVGDVCMFRGERIAIMVDSS